MGCFQAKMMKTEKKDEMEIVRRGEDIWAEGTEGSLARREIPKHLVIMVNGLVGSAEDWRFAADQFIKKLPDKVVVHRSACNSLRLTFDGVDLMGERLADEVNFGCDTHHILFSKYFMMHFSFILLHFTFSWVVELFWYIPQRICSLFINPCLAHICL